MKFQDSSFNGLKVTVGTKSVTHAPTHPLTHARSKSNMPHQLFQSWGHNESLYKWSRSVTYEKYGGPYLPYVFQDGRGLMTGLWDFLSKFGQTHKQEK